jgi:hypothetical protein
MKSLYEHLDAKQRARLALKALAKDRKPDPALFQRMLPAQREEYRGYATLIVGTNWLGLLLPMLALEMQNVARTLHSLAIFRLHSATCDLTRDFLRRYANEPITEEQYARLAKGGKRPSQPERSARFDVVPNSEGQRVTEWRERRELLDSVLGPSTLVDWGQLEGIEAEGSMAWMTVVGRLRREVREGLAGLWCELQSIVTVVRDVAQEFDGDDSLSPDIRSSLDALVRRAQQLHKEAKTELGEFELPDPDDETIDVVRQIVLKGARFFG